MGLTKPEAKLTCVKVTQNSVTSLLHLAQALGDHAAPCGVLSGSLTEPYVATYGW